MNALKVKRRIESPQAGPIGNISLLRVSEEGRGVTARDTPKGLSHRELLKDRLALRKRKERAEDFNCRCRNEDKGKFDGLKPC